jgi:isoleucyl-tRNA synthetase
MGSILESLDVLLHPISPFVTELLYQEVFAKQQGWTESILLQSPTEIAVEPSAEEDMDTVEAVLEVESAANSARMKAKLKRRWPARKLIVLATGPEDVAILERGRDLLSLLSNVKEVSFESSVASLPVTLSLRPVRSQVGAEFKDKTAAILQRLGGLEGDEAWKVYSSGKPIRVELPDGAVVDVPLGAFELNLRGAGDWEASVKGGTLVALEKVRDEGLIAEGLVRDLARRLQALRKKRGRNPTEVLESAKVAGLDEEMLRLVEPLKADLAFLVRAKTVRTMEERDTDGSWEEEELDGRSIYLDIS